MLLLFYLMCVCHVFIKQSWILGSGSLQVLVLKETIHLSHWGHLPQDLWPHHLQPAKRVETGWWIHLPGLQDATRLLVLGYSTLVGLWFNTLLFFIHMSRDLDGKFWKFKFANTGSRRFENIYISTSEQCFIQGCVLLFCRFTHELNHINIRSATGMFDIWWLSFCLCVLFVSLWNVVLILVTFVYGSCSYAITWIFFMFVSLWQWPRVWNSLPAALRAPVQQQSEDIFV